MRVPGLLAATLLWLAAAAPGLAQAGDAPPAPPAPAAASAEADDQILVMLRLPAQHLSLNAGYGGGYGDASGQAARRRIATRLARRNGLTVVTNWPMPLVGVDCFVMTAPHGRNLSQAVEALAHDPAVAWSEPMHVYRTMGSAQPAPNDPLFRLQPAATSWRLNELHEMATGRGVKVAVVDSRIDTRHPDLIGQVELSRDFLPPGSGEAEAHGTGVAGIIAAVANNNAGIVGIAPQARLMALRACHPEGAGSETVCDTLSLARALNFAAENGAEVINLSLSGPPDQLLSRLLDAAMARGAVVVGAVDPGLERGGFPASHAGVVAVGSEDGAPATAGAYLAPGRDIPTTQPQGRWSLVTGSSYAAAHVTGLLALVREKESRSGDPARIIVAHPGGVIDACATVVRATPHCSACACARPAAGSR